jgi:hypothetical protein
VHSRAFWERHWARREERVFSRRHRHFFGGGRVVVVVVVVVVVAKRVVPQHRAPDAGEHRLSSIPNRPLDYCQK